MEIAILGAGGFIGSHLVEHLVGRREHSVVAVDVSDDKLGEIDAGAFAYHEADIRFESELVEDVIRSADLVVDLVAHANPSLYVSSPIEVFELNFTENLKIARLCIEHEKRLVQYSSAEVYGKAIRGDSFSEDATDQVLGPTARQRWIYAAAKGLLERVLHAHGLAGDLNYTIIRPFNFIGSRLDYLVPAGSMGGPRVFPHFMSALLTGGPMYLVDGGHFHRAFLHIADANHGFQTIIDRPRASRNQIYNMGNPVNNVSIRELARLMIEIYAELTGSTSEPELVEVSGEEFYGEGYEDGDRYPPDIRKLRSLGWEPVRDLRSTLKDAMVSCLSTTGRRDRRGVQVCAS